MIDRIEELARLAEALGRPLPANWVIPLTRFTEQWQHYLEYQVALDTGVLELVTLGEEAHFPEKVGAYLSEIGVSEDNLALFKGMRRFAGLATWGIKVPPGGESEVQLYVKKPLSVTEVLFWLRQHRQISLDTAGQITAIAAHLGKSHTHFLGVDFSPGQPVRYQIYFTQYLQEPDFALHRVQQVLTELRLPDSLLEQFVRYHPLLAQPERTLWVSVSLADGAILPSLKLDYEDIRLGVVGMILEDLNLNHPQSSYLDIIGQALQINMANYLGFRLTANRLPALSVYLTRVRGL